MVSVAFAIPEQVLAKIRSVIKKYRKLQIKQLRCLKNWYRIPFCYSNLLDKITDVKEKEVEHGTTRETSFSKRSLISKKKNADNVTVETAEPAIIEKVQEEPVQE